MMTSVYLTNGRQWLMGTPVQLHKPFCSGYGNELTRPTPFPSYTRGARGKCGFGEQGWEVMRWK